MRPPVQSVRTWVHDWDENAAPESRHRATLVINGEALAAGVGPDWVAAAQDLNRTLRERGIEERVLAFGVFDDVLRMPK